jgi:hypothetical protein
MRVDEQVQEQKHEKQGPEYRGVSGDRRISALSKNRNVQKLREKFRGDSGSIREFGPSGGGVSGSFGEFRRGAPQIRTCQKIKENNTLVRFLWCWNEVEQNT